MFVMSRRTPTRWLMDNSLTKWATSAWFCSIHHLYEYEEHQMYLLLSAAGDSASSMHLSSWLATICRSSSSSRVSRSNCSSCGKTFTAAIIPRHPPWHSNLSPLFKTYLMPVRIKCKAHFVFFLHDLTDFHRLGAHLQAAAFCITW